MSASGNSVSAPDGFVKLKDREPRISSFGYSFIPPAGENWLEGYSPTAIVYFKQTNPKELSFFARAIEVMIKENISSEKDFLDFVESTKANSIADDLRYKNGIVRCEPDNAISPYCVSYQMTAEDHGAKNLNGNEYLVLIDKGIICLHPKIKNQVIDIHYSSRAIPNLKFTELTKEGEGLTCSAI